MPWSVKQTDQCPAGKPWGVIKDADGSLVACHETEEGAKAQQAALYASEGRGRTMPTIQRLWEGIKALFESALEAEGETDGKGDGPQQRAWDGSASRWPSTESYCASCLIDVNAAAGRDEKAQSHCMLPYKNPGSGEADVGGMHAAAGRFGQVEKPDDVSEEDWNAAVKSAANKLISAYNGHDETAPDSVYEAAGKSPPEERAIAMSRIAEQVWGHLADRETWAWPLDVYLDGADLYALVAEEGKLYRVALAVEGEAVSLGEWVQVTEVHQPVGRTLVYREADEGPYRWLGISATSVLNRVGEIDSMALFDRFVERARETGEYPARDFYHLGEPAVIGQADFLARDGAVLISGGTFADTPLAGAVRRAIQAEPEAWGDSISYLPLAEPELVEVAEGVRVPVFHDGRLRYISTLPEGRAASLFTTSRVQEVTRMRDEVLEALRGLKTHGLTDEEIDALAAQVDGTNRAIEAEGLISREGEAEPEGEPAPDPDPDPAPEPEPAEREVELDEEALAAIVERVAATGPLAGLPATLEAALAEITALREELAGLRQEAQDRAAAVDGRLEALEADDEEKRREWLADQPRRQRQTLRVTHRPRVANDPAKKPDGSGDGVSLADVAEGTLASMPRY